MATRIERIGYRYATREGRSRTDCVGAGRAPAEWVDGLGHYWGICPEPTCHRIIALTRSGGDGGTVRKHKVADFQSTR